jgi:hypothetical protein
MVAAGMAFAAGTGRCRVTEPSASNWLDLGKPAAARDRAAAAGATLELHLRLPASPVVAVTRRFAVLISARWRERKWSVEIQPLAGPNSFPTALLQD